MEIEATLKILSLEDSVKDFEFIQEQMIDAGCNIIISRVEKEAEFIASLQNNEYDIILSDFKLPGFDAYRALRIRNEICPNVPVICVSGTIGEETAIELIKLGVDDYVLKDRLKRLPLAIKRTLDEAKEKEARRLAEKAMIDSETRYRRLFESAKDGILILDAETGMIVDVNPFLIELLGYSKEQFIKKAIWDIGFFKDIVANKDVFQELQQKEYTRYDDLPLKATNGKIIDVEFVSNVYLVNSHKVIQCNIRDITNRKQSELLLKEKTKEIEVQNEEYKKINEELYIAKGHAEESDQLKTAFLHNISHEIRTPMNAIVGFSGFLNDPNLDTEKRQHFIDIIVQSSDQLLSIITDIVSMATIEAGQERIIEKEIDINAVLVLLHEQFLLKANKQAICFTLEYILLEHEVWIKTDETKLIEVLTNLIANALKFTKQGYVNFGAKVNNNEIEFFVEDSGFGIPLEMQEEIFKRFRQVETSAARQFGGSGLGLSISKAYVELLGGKMWLKSELGKGSTFYFTLPYIKVQKNTLLNKQFGGTFNSKIKELKTILVAEDDDLSFMLMEELLSGLNIHIIRAINGLEAVEICRTNAHIDLVLMDIKMPIMDGYEATRQIKSIKPNLPIIAQTAYSTNADKSKAVACGCIDFISKPVKRELLFSKIEVQLAKAIH
jgi:PAS domain S-box-containing protein